MPNMIHKRMDHASFDLIHGFMLGGTSSVQELSRLITEMINQFDYIKKIINHMNKLKSVRAANIRSRVCHPIEKNSCHVS